MRMVVQRGSVAAVLWLGLVCLLPGCRSGSDSDVVASGVIFSVSYLQGDGHTAGFTRANIPSAVPGGNGSWNVDATGRLTRDFLIILRPQRNDLGPLMIPVQRLVEVQFGEGGIAHVDENHPASPK